MSNNDAIFAKQADLMRDLLKISLTDPEEAKTLALTVCTALLSAHIEAEDQEEDFKKLADTVSFVRPLIKIAIAMETAKLKE